MAETYSVDLSPEIRSDLERGGREAGYEVKSVGDYVLLRPSDKVPDPLGMRGYFGLRGKADKAGEEIEFGCLWRIVEDGDRYRVMAVVDAFKELGIEPTKGWLPNPERIVLEGADKSWRVFYG